MKERSGKMQAVGLRSSRGIPIVLWILLGIWVLFVSTACGFVSGPNYLIGVGSYDITGPAADVNLMGYANPTQNAAGIHIRLRSRVFIVADPAPNGSRIAFVNLDACMGSQAVTLEVLERLRNRYGGLYTAKNVAISGTHSHSGPGGYMQYVLYIVTSWGFVRQSFGALVDGIEQSIIQAHENLRPGSIFVKEGELLGANINRSPSAYLYNSPEERSKYSYDVDKTMFLAKFVDEEWGDVGSFNWFAVHGTSMNRTNELISGDNKGAAARFMEDWYNKQSPDNLIGIDLELPLVHTSNRRQHSFSAVDENAFKTAASWRSRGGRPSTRISSVLSRVRSWTKNPQKPPFVAAFCQSNVGDTTPNVLGAFCDDTGLPCDFNTSTCNGRTELCNGRGPGYPADHFSSTKIIGQKQFQKAAALFDTADEQLVGKVAFQQVYVNFTNIEVNLPSGVVTTCPAAVGFSFAAGTTDGPGAFDFTQGDDKGNLFWRIVGGALKAPSAEQTQCQQPKPILIDTGEMFTPYAWAPAVLPIQILRVGQLILLAVPGEFTTMAGRRLRDSVKKVLIENGNGEFGPNTHVVIAGLTNTYSQYVTTFEEYHAQRYEGASTLYGPHTLSAYIQEFTRLAAAMTKGSEPKPGPDPPNLLNKQLGFLPGVVADGTPSGVKFGDLKQDVPANASYKVGDVVEVVFYTGCPRNDLLTEGTYSLVEHLSASRKWVSAYDDDDWYLRFGWSRPFSFSVVSYATMRWEIPETAQSGVYRIRHFGAYKGLFGAVKHFTGASSAFVVS